jgi:hypothetical protein
MLDAVCILLLILSFTRTSGRLVGLLIINRRADAGYWVSGDGQHQRAAAHWMGSNHDWTAKEVAEERTGQRFPGRADRQQLSFPQQRNAIGETRR